jgi:acylphosphatase
MTSRPPSQRRQIFALAKGRVQGVGYRAFCADEAMLLGIQGYAKNRPDGRVEVVAEGDESQLRRFVARLREGPPHARVDEVTFRWEEPTGGFAGFEAVI